MTDRDEAAEDPVARALGNALPTVRRLRWALIAVLVVVLILRLLGVIEPGWNVLLWLTAAVAVLPPLLVALTTARHLKEPGAQREDQQR